MFCTNRLETIYGHRNILYGDKLFIIGGTNGKYILDDVSMYDFDTDTWYKKASLPIPLFGHDVVLVGDKILVIGGFNNKKSLDKILIYDIINDVWSESKTTTPILHYHTLTLYKNIIYLIGGINVYGKYNKLIHIYDISLDVWAYTDGIVCKNHTATLIDGKICIVGYVQKLYDITNDRWEDYVISDYNLEKHTTNLYKNKLYILGGYKEGLIAMCGLVHKLNSYESKAMIINTTIVNHTSFVYKDMLYLLYGLETTNNKFVQKYDLIKEKWVD
jgi:N-acetylneuraminic acid mutarotase